MSVSRVAKRLPKPSSTDRRKRLADKIDSLGFPAMAPCPQCVESHSICVVQKGSSRCSCCVRKNVACGGTFSDAEFDALEAKKSEIAVKKMNARSKLTSLAWELLAVQKEHDALDAQFLKIHQRQEKMVEQEARALEELDLFISDTNPLDLAVMSDDLFSWNDPPLGLLDGTEQRAHG